MIELIKFFRILFMSAKITKEILKGFTEDHIQRLTANNPAGIFTTILTNVTSAYNNYYGDLASESLNKAVQEGKTIAMNQSREQLEKLISEDEKLITYTYRSNRDVYEEFFPQGLTEYQNADLSNFETITLRLKNVIAAHSADFAAGFILEYNTAQALFVTNKNAQSTAKANVAQERSDQATTRPALALQLTTNVLTIALHFLSDESKSAVYFDQTLLDTAFRESDRKLIAEIDPGATENTFDNVTKGDLQIKFKNTGENDLNYGFKTNETDAIPIEEHNIRPGQEITLNAAELGWTSEAKFLNVTNNSDMAGSYSVEKV